MMRCGVCGLAVLLAAVASLAGGEPRRQPVAIVVSAAWQAPVQISLATLRRLYLGRTTRWENRDVERYDLPAGDAARSAFVSSVMGLSERDLEDYWIEQALTGGAVPPIEVESAAELRRVIAQEPGRIGYLPLSMLEPADAARLRVLAVSADAGPVHPGAAGYPIEIPAGPGEPEAQLPVPRIR